MGTVFMNPENSKTSEPYRLLLNLVGKINVKRSDKYVALSNLSMCYNGEIMKKLYKSSKFKISASTRNETFKLSDGFYSVSDIQDYFEYILKEYGETTDIPS